MRGLLLTASLSILLQACPSSPAADLGGLDAGGKMRVQPGVDPHARMLRAGPAAVAVFDAGAALPAYSVVTAGTTTRIPASVAPGPPLPHDGD